MRRTTPLQTRRTKVRTSTLSIRSTVLYLAVFLALLVVVGVVIHCHVGPLTVRSGDDFVHAHKVLTDGSELFIVAHRNDSFGEPYEFSLFRVEPDGQVYVYWMGYEEPFWWDCTIQHTLPTSLIEIRVEGEAIASYDPEAKTLTLTEDPYQYGVQRGLRPTDDYLSMYYAARRHQQE